MERKYTVLIVDDESEILETYGDYLRRYGYLVDFAHDGKEGLEKLIKDSFDVALVDLTMPKLLGLDMIREARAAGVQTRFIILTGHGEKTEAVTAIKLKVQDWFGKDTIDLKELASSIADLVEPIPMDEIYQIMSLIPDEVSNE
jgi:DNA-binding response OmpR family regulator